MLVSFCLHQPLDYAFLGPFHLMYPPPPAPAPAVYDRWKYSPECMYNSCHTVLVIIIVYFYYLLFYLVFVFYLFASQLIF